MRKLAALTVISAAIIMSSCSSTSTGDASVATTSTTPVSTPQTPKPDDAQASAIDAAIADIYPGIPDVKAADWARSTCGEILGGRTEPDMIRNTTMRYSGGDRPDPTEDQAKAIIDAVRNSEWCR